MHRVFAFVAVLAVGAVIAGCGQPAQIGPVEIQPVAVSGPPAGWDMSSRLMNRRSASTAVLSGSGAGPTAGFETIAASMYYSPDHAEPFTGTIVLRADTLSSDDATLQERLVSWLEPARYPAVIFQSTGSAADADGFRAHGNLFLRDRVFTATAHWKVTRPLVRGEDLRDTGELAATMSVTVPDAPFAGGEVRLELTLPVVGYTAGFVKNLLESDGIDVDALTAASPSYPDGADELSNVAWYLMLAGHTAQALEVYDMSLARTSSLNMYLRRSDGYVFDGQYDMAVGSYMALEPYNVGEPHGLELIKVMGGYRLDPTKVAEINRALAQVR